MRTFTGSDLDEILKDIASALLKNISTAVASVTIRMLYGEELILKAVAGGDFTGRTEKIPTNGSLAGDSLQQKVPVYVEDIKNDDRYSMTQSVEQAGLVSFLAMPLFYSDEPLGAIQIYTKEKHDFTDNEIILIETLAASAAISIKHAQISSKRLDALLTLSNALHSAMTLNEILQVAVESGAHALGVSRSAIFLLTEEGEEAEIVAGFPIDEHGIGEKFSITSEHEALKKVILEKSKLVIENPADDPRMAYAHELIFHKKINAVMFLPLMCDEEVIGVMVFDATEVSGKKYFYQDDIDFALSIANIASSCICNEYARQKLLDRKKMALLGEAAGRVAHTIRNGLVPIGGFGLRIQKKLVILYDFLNSILNDDLNGKLKDILEYSEIITGDIKKLETILKDVLKFSKPLKLKLNPVEINNFMRKIIGSFDNELSEKKIKFNLEFDDRLENFAANIDSVEIEHAIFDLFRNAIDAVMEFDGERSISIKTVKNRRRCLISVINSGKQIPADYLKEIFEPFMTTKPNGTGLGLANVRVIVEAHNGKIEVESSEIETRFTIKLPI